MNYKAELDRISEKITTDILVGSTNLRIVDTEDFGWHNYRWKSDSFRMAHIERYSDDRLEVLHVTTFPHKWSPEPIFGFDVICTDNMVVGMYMDLSPGLISYPFDDDMLFKDRKPLPQWATVFSDRFILLKPHDGMEFFKFSNWVVGKYRWYLSVLASKGVTKNVDEVINVQNNYCEVQAQNPRTFSVLKAKIGESRAKFFMNEILFPKI